MYTKLRVEFWVQFSLFFVLAFIKAFKLVLQYAPLVRHTPGWRYHPEVSTGLELVFFVVVISQASFIKECIRARGASDIMVPGKRGKILKKFENSSVFALVDSFNMNLTDLVQTSQST